MLVCLCVSVSYAAVYACLLKAETCRRMQPFSLCYVKGHARMVTCLSVLAFCYTMEVSVLVVPYTATIHVDHITKPVMSCQVCPPLAQTLSRIAVKCLRLPDAKEELSPPQESWKRLPSLRPKPVLRFYNLKMGSRGSIREAPNPITWLSGLLSLQTSGGWDSGDVIKAWNDQVPKPDRLAGQRFMTVKNILAMDGPVRDPIIHIVNKLGWQGSLAAQG